MTAIALALVSSLAYGFTDFFGGMASRRTSVFVVGAVAQPAGLVLLFALLLGATGLVPLLRFDRLPVHHVLVAVVAIPTVFIAGRIQSDARYLGIAWPLAWALTRWRGYGGRDLLPLAWGGLYVAFAFLHVTRTLAP